MKKTSSLALLLFMFSAIILTSCNGSVKGKWSEADKKKFYSEDDTEMKNIFNEAGVDKKAQSEIIDCYYEKLQNAYSSYADARKNLTDKMAEKIVLDCIESIGKKYNKNSGSSENDEAPIEETTKKEGEEVEDY